MLIRDLKELLQALKYRWLWRFQPASMYPSRAAKVGRFGVIPAPVARRSRRFFGPTATFSCNKLHLTT